MECGLTPQNGTNNRPISKNRENLAWILQPAHLQAHSTWHALCYVCLFTMSYLKLCQAGRIVAFGIIQDSSELFFQKKNDILSAYCILSFRFSPMQKETSLWPISHPDNWWQPSFFFTPSKLSNPFYKAKKVNAKPMSYPVFFLVLPLPPPPPSQIHTHAHSGQIGVWSASRDGAAP